MPGARWTVRATVSRLAPSFHRTIDTQEMPPS